MDAINAAIELMNFKAGLLGYDEFADPMVEDFIEANPDIAEKLINNFLKYPNVADDEICPFCLKFFPDDCDKCPWAEEFGDCGDDESLYTKIIALPDGSSTSLIHLITEVKSEDEIFESIRSIIDQNT